MRRASYDAKKTRTIPYDISFLPSWWNKHTGVNFNLDFHYNADYRIESDVVMRKCLYEKFGDFGLGERRPKPRPIIGSPLILAGFILSELLGCEVKYYDADSPQVVCAELSDTDIKKLRVPDLKKVHPFNKIVKQVEYVERKFGYVEGDINLQGVQNLALDLRGPKLFMDYYNKPDLARRLLSICTDTMIEVIGYLKEHSKSTSFSVIGTIIDKIDPSLTITSNCSVEMISNDIYEKFLLEHDRILGQHFPPFGIHHCGKSMEHVLPGYEKVKEAVFFEVGAGSDLKECSSRLAGKWINARYSPVKLKDCSIQEITADVREMILSVPSKNKFSISCVGTGPEVEDKKVRAFLGAIKRFGEIKKIDKGGKNGSN